MTSNRRPEGHDEEIDQSLGRKAIDCFDRLLGLAPRDEQLPAEEVSAIVRMIRDRLTKSK